MAAGLKGGTGVCEKRSSRRSSASMRLRPKAALTPQAERSSVRVSPESRKHGLERQNFLAAQMTLLGRLAPEKKIAPEKKTPTLLAPLHSPQILREPEDDLRGDWYCDYLDFEGVDPNEDWLLEVHNPFSLPDPADPLAEANNPFGLPEPTLAAVLMHQAAPKAGINLNMLSAKKHMDGPSSTPTMSTVSTGVWLSESCATDDVNQLSTQLSPLYAVRSSAAEVSSDTHELVFKPLSLFHVPEASITAAELTGETRDATRGRVHTMRKKVCKMFKAAKGSFRRHKQLDTE